MRQALFALALLLLLPATASADVYLNGVKVNNTLAEQTFDGAKVHFDAKGDVHITVSGIKVYREGDPQAGAQQRGPAIPKGTWWLVAEQTAPGMTQYSIEVHINGKLVKRIKDDQRQVAMDIAQYLQPGQNQVSFTAIKDLSQTRRSFSSDHSFSLILGQGASQDKGLVISEVAARYTRTAMDVENHTRTFTFQVQP